MRTRWLMGCAGVSLGLVVGLLAFGGRWPLHLADAMREAATLVAVFALLDRIQDGRAVSLLYGIGTMFVCLALFAAGCILEAQWARR